MSQSAPKEKTAGRLRLLLWRTLPWVVAAGLIGWLAAQLSWSDIVAAIASLDSVDWMLWIAVNALVLALLTSRWLTLTNAIGLKLRFLSLLRVRQVGQLISFVTPGPQFGSEPLQVYWLHRRYGCAGPKAFLAVCLDRLFELWVNFAVLLVAVLALMAITALPGMNWSPVVISLLGLVAGVSGFAWLLWIQPGRLQAVINKLAESWQSDRLRGLESSWIEVGELTRQVSRGRKRSLLLALVLSLLGWLGMVAEFCYLLSLSGVPLTAENFLLLFAAVRLAFLLPLPGGLGSVEAAVLWSFQTLALPLSAAAGLIALMRLRDVVILLIGAVALPGMEAQKTGS